MTEPKTGRQEPTQEHILPYEKTIGQEAIDLYNASKRTAMPWQEQLVFDIMARNDEEQWVHSRFGYSVPRRNGKSENVHSGWAEWSVEEPSDPRDKSLWYETNPSLGYHLKERAILDEVGDNDNEKITYYGKYAILLVKVTLRIQRNTP